jgi:hypothetical protein
VFIHKSGISGRAYCDQLSALNLCRNALSLRYGKGNLAAPSSLGSGKSVTGNPVHCFGDHINTYGLNHVKHKLNRKGGTKQSHNSGCDLHFLVFEQKMDHIRPHQKEPNDHQRGDSPHPSGGCTQPHRRSGWRKVYAQILGDSWHHPFDKRYSIRIVCKGTKASKGIKRPLEAGLGYLPESSFHSFLQKDKG